jgi:dephospho-CoA kinase
MEAEHPNTQLVIGITGQMGSGKTTAAEYLAAEHGFNHIRYSQVIADWYGEDPERKSRLQEVGWEVMSGGLQPELNERLLSKITPDRDWVVEGLRHPLDYESLKNAFASSFHLVYIESSQQTRWLRLQNIPRFQTFEDFCEAENKLVEKQIPSLKKFADLRIAGGEPLQQLYEPLMQFVASLRKGNQ